MRTVLAAFALLLALPAAALAGGPAPGSPEYVARDNQNIKDAYGRQTAPDGQLIAYLKARDDDKDRFDLDLTAEVDAYDALGELAPLLARIAEGTPQASITAAVADFRRWLNEEAARQAVGDAPQRCPLPS